MSSVLLGALFLQLTAIVLMRHRLGRTWLRRPVTLLVLAAVIYSGLSECLLSFPSVRAWDAYRLGTSQRYIDLATLYMSVGLLSLVACYLLVKPGSVTAAERDSALVATTRILDWRLCGMACVPLAVLTYRGQGYNRAAALGASNVSNNIAAEFLIILVAFTAFGFLLRHGMRWLIIVLATQSTFLATTGERLPLVAGSVILLILLAHVGLVPSRTQVCVLLILTAVTVMGITGYRTVSGRGVYSQNSNLTERVQAVGVGLYSLSHTSNANDTSPGLVTQAAVRLDGNAFAGAVMQSLHSRGAPLGITPVLQSVCSSGSECDVAFETSSCRSKPSSNRV